MVLFASMVVLLGGWESGAGRREPPIEVLRSLIEDYAHAIETNNRELALSYVHPRSPHRSDIEASLRDQLASYLERARTSNLERIEHADGTVSVKLDQEIVRVLGIKFTRGSRRSTYHFRDLGGTWRIWEIDVAAGP
jgi:ribosome-binding protein aMBF1 (putative translation factor)